MVEMRRRLRTAPESSCSSTRGAQKRSRAVLQLAQDQLEPQLVDLVHRDEEHLVVLELRSSSSSPPCSASSCSTRM
jgi:hypothetical protein